MSGGRVVTFGDMACVFGQVSTVPSLVYLRQFTPVRLAKDNIWRLSPRMQNGSDVILSKTRSSYVYRPARLFHRTLDEN